MFYYKKSLLLTELQIPVTAHIYVVLFLLILCIIVFVMLGFQCSFLYFQMLFRLFCTCIVEVDYFVGKGEICLLHVSKYPNND